MIAIFIISGKVFVSKDILIISVKQFKIESLLSLMIFALRVVLWYTGVISGGHAVKVLKVPKLSQTKVFDKKSENF